MDEVNWGAPTPGFRIQSILGGESQESAFLTSSWIVFMVLASGIYFENFSVLV